MTAKERYQEALAKNGNRSLRQRFHMHEPTERHRQVAKDVLRHGKTIKGALMAAGYSEKQSNKGMHTVRHIHGLKVAFQELTKTIEAELKADPLVPNSWNAREQLIIQRLEKNIRSGQDGGVASAKLLGSHRALNLWRVESPTGVIIIDGPGLAMLGPHEEVPEE